MPGPHRTAREQRALELSDDVVQGLAVAKYALEAGDTGRAADAVDAALASARKVITELAGTGPEGSAGGMVRNGPATTGGAAPPAG